MEASEVLDKATAALLEFGWCKNALKNMKGELCLLGACQYGEHGSAGMSIAIHHDAYRALHHVIGGSPAQWNNAPERTFADVVDALDRARLVAKQREAEVA